MKRFFFWLLIGAVVFGLVFIGLNLFDSRTAPAVAAPPSLDANLEPGNAFFILWGFAEPGDNDPGEPAFRARLLELFNAPARNALFRSLYGQWLARLNDSFRRDWQGTKLHFPKQPGEDVCAYFASHRALINEQQQHFAVPLSRYRHVLTAPSLEDFTPLDWVFPARSFSLAAYTARIFAASRALAAMDGDWQAAGDDLIAALAAGLKLIRSGRTMTVNSLGKTMVELSLRTLGSLLNRGNCPPEVVLSILARLPGRTSKEFGTAAVRAFTWMSFARALERIEKDKVVDAYMLKDYFRKPAGFFALERFVAISGPKFFGVVHALASFFLKKNESTAALRSFWEEVGRLEETPPASWPNARRPVAALTATLRFGPLWWLRNPLGKMMVRSAVPYTWPVLQHYVYRSHQLKVRYDLTRLLAQARLQTGWNMSLDRTALKGLLHSAAEGDPFSGKPYLFDPGSGMLYSVGPDGKDDQGREMPAVWRDSDIAVPIKFVKHD